MKFHPVEIAGVVLIEPERFEDQRGFFARVSCREEMTRNGLEADIVQSSISFNHRAGTVRGMHYQAAPHEETKVVRCVRGAIRDVVVDLRRDSATFGQHQGFDLDSENRLALYIPGGLAHGFQTLRDDTEILYQMSVSYVPEASRGFRWNDPSFEIEWPLEVSVISPRDLAFPDFEK